ncbi:TolC family protein [Sandaracinus amylolyticus]|uniref:Heavy metal RND efflux outer membrane protein, CzcC family n=1 Tax=Sandaracinus amylolyticus TaxID=927083 RepID=A0A0F6W5D9_9BACT|nr:TolC family protein [Sandaracinus amylolyticus]AKF07855.1 Heavy metal RND efflux outer membrane protein, CzcC family [Sandaracinus amylolyticus]
MQSLIIRVPLLVALLALPSAASAQQPLYVFLRAAEEGGALDVREAELTRDQARSQVDEARARLLPSLSASAGYTRNQAEVVAEFPAPDDTGMLQTQRAVITPYDQLEARVALTVPLIDVGAWSSFFGAEASADAETMRADARAIDVRVSVVTAYHALVAARAVQDAAARTLSAAEENLAVVSSRADAGLASELDRQRAIADVERAHQSVAEADLQEALASRQLYVATSLEPDGTRASLDASLEDEAPLATWMRAASDLPAVRAAVHDVRAAELARDAAWQSMLPTISASASERITNAAGFGPEALWAVGVSASWVLDFGRPASLGTRERQIALAEVRLDRAQRSAETSIYEAWHRVRSLVARARSARAAEAASERAAVVARARAEAGTGTQLELSQAERDLFSASVQRIQADADLEVSRLALRLRSGLSIDAGGTP